MAVHGLQQAATVQVKGMLPAARTGSAMPCFSYEHARVHRPMDSMMVMVGHAGPGPAPSITCSGLH